VRTTSAKLGKPPAKKSAKTMIDARAQISRTTASSAANTPDVGQIRTPGEESRSQSGRLAGFDAPTQVVEPECQKRAKQQEAGRQPCEKCRWRARKNHLQQPAGGGKTNVP
jgi:hypothetical protein